MVDARVCVSRRATVVLTTGSSDPAPPRHEVPPAFWMAEALLHAKVRLELIRCGAVPVPYVRGAASSGGPVLSPVVIPLRYASKPRFRWFALLCLVSTIQGLANWHTAAPGS